MKKVKRQRSRSLSDCDLDNESTVTNAVIVPKLVISKCGICQHMSAINMVKCCLCKQSFHIDCVGNSEVVDVVDIVNNFSCENCNKLPTGGLHFVAILERLTSAVRSRFIGALFSCANRELFNILKYGNNLPFHYQIDHRQLIQDVTHHKYSTDLLQSGGVTNQIALDIPADGNCLFHSIGILIFGSIFYSLELRIRSFLELSTNFDYYKRIAEEFS